jgi:hypothetical protein
MMRDGTINLKKSRRSLILILRKPTRRLRNTGRSLRTTGRTNYGFFNTPQPPSTSKLNLKIIRRVNLRRALLRECSEMPRDTPLSTITECSIKAT